MAGSFPKEEKQRSAFPGGGREVRSGKHWLSPPFRHAEDPHVIDRIGEGIRVLPAWYPDFIFGNAPFSCCTRAGRQPGGRRKVFCGLWAARISAAMAATGFSAPHRWPASRHSAARFSPTGAVHLVAGQKGAGQRERAAAAYLDHALALCPGPDRPVGGLRHRAGRDRNWIAPPRRDSRRGCRGTCRSHDSDIRASYPHVHCIHPNR